MKSYKLQGSYFFPLSKEMNDLYQQSVQATNFREKIEKMSILAGDFMKLLRETREDYKNMQSPIHRNTYNTLLTNLASEILTSHPNERDMFMDERLLATMSDLMLKKIVIKLKTPGQIWDSSITDKICKMLAFTPAEERRENKDLLKCVAELPAFHPLRAGAGTWHAIHIMASTVTTPEDHIKVCSYIRAIQNHFYCEICKLHFGKYLTENPPELLLRPPRNSVSIEVKNVDTGETFIVTKLFDWTVKFHNVVNAHRINYLNSTSPLVMSISQAHKIYYTDQYDTCSDCRVKK
jgi:hypothetical protein